MATKHTHIIEARAKGFNKAAQKSEKLKGSLSSLKNSVVGMAGAYLGAAGLIAGIKGSVDAFAEQERAEKKLQIALKGNTTALLNQASALQKVSMFGDEAIISQQAFLASIGMTEQQIKDILPVAIDLASATGLTLESAVRNTAKTFSGLAGELGELVPQVRDLTAEQMKAGDAVKVMGELFKNQGSAEAFTFAGRVTRVQEVLGDMAEDIGSSIVPALDALAFAFLKATGGVGQEELLTIQIQKQEELLAMLVKTDGDLKRNTGSLLAGTKDEINFSFKNNKELIEETKNTISDLESELNLLRTGFTTEELNRQQRESEARRQSHDQFMDDINEEIETEKFRSKLTIANDELKKIKSKDLTQALKEKRLTDLLGAETEWNAILSLALSDAAKAAISAGSGLPFPANIIAGARTLASNAPQLATIYANKPAQTGFEGVVDEPTQFTVGEGGAAEYVSVTPLEGVNNAGGGQGMTINITGNVMSQEFVNEELPSKIQEAVRQGIDFGIV